MLNAGSSSLKFALFGTDAGLTATMRGAVGEVASAPHLLTRDAAGAVLAERRWPVGSASPLADLLGTRRKQPKSTTSATAPVDRKQVSCRARKMTDGISSMPAIHRLAL